MERDIKESRLEEAEEGSTLPHVDPGPKAEAPAPPLPKPYRGHKRAKEHRDSRSVTQQHSQSVSLKEAVAPVLGSIQDRTGDRLDAAFQTSHV